MLRAYAVPDVRAAEDEVRAGLADGELMRRAAHGLAEVVAARHGERGGGRVVVLAGPGDNGGDALHAAALLVDGADRDVHVVGIAERLHAGGLAAARAAGLTVHDVAPDSAELPGAVQGLLSSADLVVDGLLGIGGRAGLRGAMVAAVRAVPDTAYVLSVDLPSGADPAGLEALGETVLADETVTFSMLKPVHLLPATEPAVGVLTVVEIGVRMEAPPAVERLEHTDAADLWPVPGPTDHKYTRGVVGVVAGSDAYPGAAVLCVTAALETGTGMVRYLGPRRAEDLVLASCPEAVPGPGRVQAAVVGPGIDPQGCEEPECSDGQVHHMREALDADTALVVDAGGLQTLAFWLRGERRDVEGGFRAREAGTLLTPHAGELASLLAALEDRPVTREQVQADPVGHARRAAVLTGAVVLLKGSSTLIVDPDPAVPVRTQADAPPWLATAGAGDVLAGICGALLAAGLPPREAGSVGALVHGLAAGHANPGGPVRATSVAGAVAPVVAGLLRG
ncbi:bifunctional ADP-dependent NAD(P)H-hydrate dehydratase/NAD(P)H-hydrate epimerase [uncultured Serinicoccus sp.]|uniref:bifunctional ADP-dependent NAD(P)H-hydrate dehydratase/NAD(P)H-hydrate epimerase n=1 Tax=uncultured Serinicoccus sp. TaxID=735514 RepID=UPI002639A3A4|nr:bifunctional ADP-dependent NAD(P)H-hydrate dehydratase/NAD(P)H-hydrate epimerase [uncultured Serinicoccus sp.]